MGRKITRSPSFPCLDKAGRRQTVAGSEHRHRGCSRGGSRSAASWFLELCHDRTNHACPETSCNDGGRTVRRGAGRAASDRPGFSATGVLGRSLDARVLAVLFRSYGRHEPRRGRAQFHSVPYRRFVSSVRSPRHGIEQIERGGLLSTLFDLLGIMTV